MGWRLLYSPVQVLTSADVALIGLNPGGNSDDEGHPDIATSAGSAYVSESWKGRPPGRYGLQLQVRALFEGLGVEPDRVLAGNLVPFRSPDWPGLKNKKEALAFGRQLWSCILSAVRPSLVITMGDIATTNVGQMIGITSLSAIPVGWGTVTARTGRNGTQTLVGLPHLSRFTLFGRPEGAPPLAILFGPAWKGPR